MGQAGVVAVVRLLRCARNDGGGSTLFALDPRGNPYQDIHSHAGARKRGNIAERCWEVIYGQLFNAH